MTSLRKATPDDVPALQALIARSGMELSAADYTPEQAEAMTQHVFGVDTQLIVDGTYFIIEVDGEMASWRRAEGGASGAPSSAVTR